MIEKKLESLISAFKILDEESLNQDPFSFSGKYVVPLGESNIIKIMSTFDANGELQIEQDAERQGLNFFTQSTVLYQGLVTVLKQPKLTCIPFENRKEYNLPSLNYWCPTDNLEEKVISELVYKHYGEENFYKIKEFCEKWYLGNIYWRNIGFDKDRKIQCFDFHCGLSRNRKGEYRCINRDV